MTDQLPGKPYPTDETDQQCDECGRWFDKCAIDVHQDNCLVGSNPYIRYSEEKNELEKRRCRECGRLIPWNADMGNVEYHKAPCSLP